MSVSLNSLFRVGREISISSPVRGVKTALGDFDDRRAELGHLAFRHGHRAFAIDLLLFFHRSLPVEAGRPARPQTLQHIRAILGACPALSK